MLDLFILGIPVVYDYHGISKRNWIIIRSTKDGDPEINNKKVTNYEVRISDLWSIDLNLMEIDLIPLRYPVVVIPCGFIFHGKLSLNFLTMTIWHDSFLLDKLILELD